MNPLPPESPLVVFLHDDSTQEPEHAYLEAACRFYDIQLALHPLSLTPALTVSHAPMLVIVHGADLAKATPEQVREWLTVADGYAVPIAIVGITTECDPKALALFSAGHDVRVRAAPSPCALWIPAPEPTDTGFELRDLGFHLGSGPFASLECSQDSSVRVLASHRQDATASHSALVRIHQHGDTRYLLTRTISVDTPRDSPPEIAPSRFAEIAPFLLLLRDVGGARCWHAPHSLANLTIDDPWLIEPFGRLSFPGLLEQMRRERFHATIGFVPWNFDRSFPDVVALLHQHPDRFSIAVHGNNHDGYEFYRYETPEGDGRRPKSLTAHDANIQQARARMAEFQRQTGLAYDQVMVFPHGVCPAATFGLLKKYGFEATANYSNVHLDERPPSDPAIRWRAANDRWHGFPALRRSYPKNYSEEAIAIDLFLGNPVLFMAHQDLFFAGIDAFNAHARIVNRRQPSVRWASLGDIARHLYLLRCLADDRCDVRLLSYQAEVTNSLAATATFSFCKREPDAASIDCVTANEIPIPWTMLDGEIRFSLTVPPSASVLVKVQHHRTDNPVSVDIRRRGFRHHALRWLADSRDIALSRSSLGRALVSRYYRKRRPTLRGLGLKAMALLRGDRHTLNRSGHA